MGLCFEGLKMISTCRDQAWIKDTHPDYHACWSGGSHYISSEHSLNKAPIVFLFDVAVGCVSEIKKKTILTKWHTTKCSGGKGVYFTSKSGDMILCLMCHFYLQYSCEANLVSHW